MWSASPSDDSPSPDNDIRLRAGTIGSWYHGYPYVHCYDPSDWALVHEAECWCRAYTKGKWRSDIHRMDQYRPGNIRDWPFEPLFGGDYAFFAFQNEQALNWFILRWDSEK